MNDLAFVVVPQPSVIANQPNQILFPGSLSQPPRIIQHGDHTLFTGCLRNQFLEGTGPAGNRYTEERRGEPKVLGAIQILIAFIHWGFGSVLTCLWRTDTFIFISGYVYWGGLFYLISGSLMVAAERKQRLNLVKGSLGMNIISSLAAATGTILFLVDENVLFSYSFSPYALERKLAQGLSNVLLIFTLLEFFIGLTATSYGYDSINHQDDEAISFLPEAFATHQGTLPPVGPPPPYEEHDNVTYENSACSNA